MTLKLLFFSIVLSLGTPLAAQEKFLLRTTASKESIPLQTNLLQQKYPQAHKKVSTLKPQVIKLKTPKQVEVTTHFYDHGKDQIIILGQGFRGNKESMDYFVKAFGTSYDMITFDYRWGNNFALYCVNPKTLISPLNQLVHAQQEEVNTVIDFVKKRKNYKDVICLGLCFSGFLFLMAQAEAEKKGSLLFTKMIIDSCWYSLDAFLESIRQDPLLPAHPQAGGTPGLVKGILRHSPAYRLIFRSVKSCMPSICIKDYAGKVSIPPIFFIHGADDKLVPLDYFDQMWASCPASKVGLITPYQHADNFINYELYTLLCDQFIQSRGIDEFVQSCLLA